MPAELPATEPYPYHRATRLVGTAALGLTFLVACSLRPTTPSDLESAPTLSCESDNTTCSKSDMQLVANYAVTIVDDAIERLYRDMPQSKTIYVAGGQTLKTSCVDIHDEKVIANENSMTYCAADKKTYIGQAALWALYDDGGIAAVFFGYAHETGHLIQTERHVPQPKGPKQNILHENQADCMAGGILQVLQTEETFLQDDFDEVLEQIASASGPTTEGTQRDHGTLEERTESFHEGFNGGMGACNIYYPDKPVINIK